MGTARTDYVIAGYRFDLRQVITIPDEIPDSYHDNGYNREFDGDSLNVIVDGMNGRYLFVGFILAKAAGEEGGGLPIVKCNKQKWMLKRAKREAVSLFPNGAALGELGVWAFTHWH